MGMSLKPDKKSDRGKRWMSPRNEGTRKVKIPYHLVVTEGTKTEPNYFYGLKTAINKNDGLEKVHLEISGEGMNTVSLVEMARQLARNAGKTPALSAPGTQLHTMLKSFLPYLEE